MIIGEEIERMKEYYDKLLIEKDEDIKSESGRY